MSTVDAPMEEPARHGFSWLDLRGLATLFGLLLVWEIWVRLPGQNAVLTVSFVEVLKTGVSLAKSGALERDYLASVARVFVGFIWGGVAGLTLGALLGISAWADRILGPVFTILRQAPIFGLVPLISVWFGTADLGKIVLVALAAFYPILLHTHEGLRSASRNYHDVATVFMFNRAQLLRRVRIPCALPTIFTGVRHAIAFAWISGVGSELFMPSDAGIGALLGTGRIQLRMDYIWLGIVIIGATGYAINRGLAALENMLLRWRPAYNG